MSIRSFGKYRPQLGRKVFIDPSALVIGRVTIGHDSSVWPMAVVRGDVHCISIGDRSSIQDASVLHVTHAGPYAEHGYPLEIGDDVTVGHRAVIHGCKIDDQCLIGMGAVVMDNAMIHSKVLLAANSLVPPNKELEGGFLWQGSPAKKIRPLSRQEMAFFDYSARNYVKLKDQYLLELNLSSVELEKIS